MSVPTSPQSQPAMPYYPQTWPTYPPSGRQQVVVLGHVGGVEGFELHDQPMPHAGPGEIRVRVLAAGVQCSDLTSRHARRFGLRDVPPPVLGDDVIGEVDEVGLGVASCQVGDVVAALTVAGSYARYRTLRAGEVVRVPRGVDPAEAAALLHSWTTAFQLLHRIAHVVEGQRVLVVGAATGVGQALLTLGKLAGLQMWGAVHDGHADVVRALGATPIDVRLASARSVVPLGFDAVFDGEGERGGIDSWAAVRPGGALVVYAFGAAIDGDVPPWRIGWWRARLWLWNRWPSARRASFYSLTEMRAAKPSWFRTDLERLFVLLAADMIQPRIADEIGLEGVGDAHRRLENGELTGEIILRP